MPTFNFQPIRLLDPDCCYKFAFFMANSADPDQLASSEANWSGSALFAKQGISGFSMQGLKVLPHPPYSPGLAPADFNWFPNLKTNLSGRSFGSNEGLIDQWLGDQEEGFYFEGISKLEQHWTKHRGKGRLYWEILTGKIWISFYFSEICISFLFHKYFKFFIKTKWLIPRQKVITKSTFS